MKESKPIPIEKIVLLNNELIRHGKYLASHESKQLKIKSEFLIISSNSYKFL